MDGADIHGANGGTSAVGLGAGQGFGAMVGMSVASAPGRAATRPVLVSDARGACEIRTSAAVVVTHSPQGSVTATGGSGSRRAASDRRTHAPDASVIPPRDLAEDFHARDEWLTPTRPPGRSAHAPGEWMQQIGSGGTRGQWCPTWCSRGAAPASAAQPGTVSPGRRLRPRPRPSCGGQSVLVMTRSG